MIIKIPVYVEFNSSEFSSEEVNVLKDWLPDAISQDLVGHYGIKKFIALPTIVEEFKFKHLWYLPMSRIDAFKKLQNSVTISPKKNKQNKV